MGQREGKPAHKSGWRQWTVDDAREVVGAWRASGLPLAAFARQRGVGGGRIKWWERQLGEWKGAPDEDRQRLVPAVLTRCTPKSAAETGTVVTVRASGDVVVEVSDVGAVPASWLSALVLGLARRAP